ncbi:MAG: VIT1/CCC1 transporter family protein [Burkholderiaceae bacterium]
MSAQFPSADGDGDGSAEQFSAWREEAEAANVYRALAAQEADHRMAYMLQRLAEQADEQAGLWARHLSARQLARPIRPGMRAKLAIWLAGHFGVRPVRGILSTLKVRGMSAYGAPGYDGHVAIDDVGQLQSATGGSGNLRAAVFGVNDGLVSNTSLILGMAGATSDSGVLLLAGVAGLLAGAMSMAAGEYISVRSQREVLEYQLALEKAELEEYPDAERRELAVIYEAKGLSPEESDRIARKLIANPALALDTMAREELGLNPDELGSPTGAALASFLSFAIGASIPVLPFAVSTGTTAMVTAAGAAGAALFVVGATLSLFTGRGALRSGLRMLGIGAGAGLLTWMIGHLLGAQIGL